MALLALLGLIRRQFIAMIAGLALTGLALFYVHGIHPIYYAQVNYQLLAPSGEWWINVYQDVTPSLISTAGVLSRTVTDHRRAQPVSQSVTLLGQGINHGYSVRLPNFGGQWALNFTRPVLNVEVSAGSEEEARQDLNALLKRMDDNLLQMQSHYGAPRRVLITSQLSPRDPQIYRTTGSSSRALGMTMIIGVGLTIVGSVLLDRRRARRRLAAEATEVEDLADDDWTYDGDWAEAYEDEDESQAVPQLSR
jgi:hypothetical protein